MEAVSDCVDVEEIISIAVSVGFFMYLHFYLQTVQIQVHLDCPSFNIQFSS
jgi:hypothetical protein